MSCLPNTPEDSVRAAVRAVRAGDRAAFRVLVETYQHPLYGVLFRYLKNRDDCLDVTQRAFVRAFERLEDLTDDGAFKPWLFRIAINLALSQIRSSQRGREEDLDSIPEPSREAQQEELVAQKQRSKALYEALETLSPTQKKVILLKLEGGLNAKEIAASADLSEGAVRVHVHNAIKRLRAHLDPERGSIETES